MNIKNRSAFSILCLILGACQAAGLTSQVPARLLIANTDAQKTTQQELQEVVARMLGVREIHLAENTLTDRSQFVYARTPRFDASGQLVQGRVIEQTQIFKLVIRDKACWLIHQNSGQQTLLIHAKCVAE